MFPAVAPVSSVLVAPEVPLPTLKGSCIEIFPPAPTVPPDPAFAPPPVEIFASIKVMFSPLVFKVTAPPAPPVALLVPPASLPVVVMLPPASIIICPLVVPSTPAVRVTSPPA